MQEKKGRATSQFVSVMQPFIVFMYHITCYIPMMDNTVNLTGSKIREKPLCAPLRSDLG